MDDDYADDGADDDGADIYEDDDPLTFSEEEEEEELTDSDKSEKSDDDEDGDEDESEKEKPAKRVAVKSRQAESEGLQTSSFVRVIPPDERITSNFLQPHEMASILATRAEQIAANANCFQPGCEKLDPVAAAIAELYGRRCPLVLRRIIRQEGHMIIVEDWVVRQMSYPAPPARQTRV